MARAGEGGKGLVFLLFFDSLGLAGAALSSKPLEVGFSAFLRHLDGGIAKDIVLAVPLLSQLASHILRVNNLRECFFFLPPIQAFNKGVSPRHYCPPGRNQAPIAPMAAYCLMYFLSRQ